MACILERYPSLDSDSMAAESPIDVGMHHARPDLSRSSRRAMENKPPIVRVFLLDDHELVRRGLRDLLEQEADLEVVGEAGTAHDAIARIPALRPDVAHP
jgi:PleD family two-component response regulator